MSTSEKMFSFRARAEKGIARHRHIDASGVGLRPSNFWLVRSEHAHASYPGLFFRPPGLSPYIGAGRKESSGTGLEMKVLETREQGKGKREVLTPLSPNPLSGTGTRIT